MDKLCSRNFDNASALVHEANRIFTYASGYVQNNVVQELKRLFFYDNVMLYDVPAREEFCNLIHETGTMPFASRKSSVAAAP